jgi:hypothetical protein
MANSTNKFKSWLSRKTEGCKSVSPLFSAALERKLSFFERMRVKIHLFTCGACLNYVSNLKFMQDTFKMQGERDDEETANKLSADAKDRIKNALRSS